MSCVSNYIFLDNKTEWILHFSSYISVFLQGKFKYKCNFQISTLWSFSIYTSPFILTTLYRRDMFTPNGAVTLSKFLMGVCIVYVVSMNIRALGRATNPTYKEFLGVLTSALRDFNPESKRLLQFYDFEFSSWPVEFSMKGR